MNRSPTVLLLVCILSCGALAADDGPIFEAIAAGDVERVRTLVTADPSLLTAEDSSGRTPFHRSILRPHPELWNLLVSPERLDAVDSLGLRPVFLAITNSKPDALQWLIEQGADIQTPKRGDGQSPLHWAAELNRTEQVRALLVAGAEVDAENLARSTPLLIAAKLGSLDSAQLLLESGADANRGNLVGLTPLMIAALRDYREIVELLLAAGADPTARDRRGSTAEEYARQKGYQETADLLAEAASSE